jgi:hypothetical protein
MFSTRVVSLYEPYHVEQSIARPVEEFHRFDQALEQCAAISTSCTIRLRCENIISRHQACLNAAYIE